MLSLIYDISYVVGKKYFVKYFKSILHILKIKIRKKAFFFQLFIQLNYQKSI